MKIAYLILAHNAPKQIERLTNRLSKTGDCFVHLDKKTNKKDFLKDFQLSSAVHLYSRYKVSWAGWSMVKAYMYLLEQAFASGEKYDRLVLMTGQDYPLMSDSEIIREFEGKPNVEYIMAYNIRTSTIATDKNKVLKKWYFDVPFKNKFLRRCYLSFMYRVFTKPFASRDLSILYKGKKVDPYFGQMLSAFTRDGAKLLLDAYNNEKKFNKKMKKVHAAVELYWQTIIFNSDLRKNTIQAGEEHEITEHFGWAPLHYHTYDVYTSIYDERNFEELKNCRYMFCRKVVPGLSDSLMDKIDEWRNEKENSDCSK